MDFLNNVKKVAADTAQVAANTAQAAVKKSGELVETAKVKYAIFDLKNEIRSLYEKIGTEVYNNYAGNAEVSETVNRLCAEIDGCHARIAELTRQLGDLKKMVSCARCGRQCQIDMEYCPYCGSRLNEREAVEAEVPEE